MTSPIELYKKVAKDFNITPEKTLHPRQQLAYVQEQANQQKQIINRLLCDIAVTTAQLATAKDDNTKAAYSKKIADYEADLRQLSRSLDFFLELEDNFVQSNPGVEPGAYPEA